MLKANYEVNPVVITKQLLFKPQKKNTKMEKELRTIFSENSEQDMCKENKVT